MEEKKFYQVNLYKPTYDRLKEYCNEYNLSMALVCRLAIEDFLKGENKIIKISDNKNK